MPACNHLFKNTCGCAVEALADSAVRLHDTLTPGTALHAQVQAQVFGTPVPLPFSLKDLAPAPVPVPAPAPSPALAAPNDPAAVADLNKKIQTRKRGSYIPWTKKDDDELSVEQQILLLASTPEGCEILEKLVKAEGCKRSFAAFFQEAWKVIEPSTTLIWNWHLTLMCCVAQSVFFDWLRAKKNPKYLNRIRNVLVNVPPGSSKSKVWSVAFQAWAWLHCPGMKFICLSVNDNAAMRDARAMREILRSSWYIETFKPSWTLRGDQDAVSNFGNTAGGERLSMPSKSIITGVRADCLTVDDANDTSENEKERKEVNNNWDASQANRVNDLMRSLRFGVQQRTGAGDWSEHVVERQGVWSPENTAGWLQVILPAEFEGARKFVMPPCLVEILRECLQPEEIVFEDPRAVEGETIDKQRLPPQALLDERKKWEGTGNYASQMNQRPAEQKGGKIKREYWNWFRLETGVREDIDEIPLDHPRPDLTLTDRKEFPAHLVPAGHYRPGKWDFDWVTLSIDCAAKKTERGSAWGMVLAAGRKGQRYILDDLTQRGDILDIVEILRAGIKKWRPDTVLIEDKAAGEELRKRLMVEMTKGDMPMVELVLLKPKTGEGREQGKEQRLDACISVIANRLVHLLDGASWLEAFVSEMGDFPYGRLNDRVDCLTQVLNHYVEYAEDDWPDL